MVSDIVEHVRVSVVFELPEIHDLSRNLTSKQ